MKYEKKKGFVLPDKINEHGWRWGWVMEISPFIKKKKKKSFTEVNGNCVPIYG